MLIIDNWLCIQWLLFLEDLTKGEQETSRTIKGLHTEIILSLQYCKLSRWDDENAEWLGRLQLMAAECRYKELDRHLKEQFINGLNDNSMTGEIICELKSLSGMSCSTPEQVLAG